MTLLQIAVIGALALLIAFFLVMWVRLVFDWARVLRPNWRPHGLALVLAESAYAITDPPIQAVRRILPPIRVGAARIEFSWSIVMLACLAMIWIVGLFA
ncbi:MAG TPA: YggT family protein [Pseudolysinimonas sp.]